MKERSKEMNKRKTNDKQNERKIKNCGRLKTGRNGKKKPRKEKQRDKQKERKN